MKYLLLIGAQKSGTSYLHNLLAQDAKIAVDPKKEPKYFAKPKYEGSDYQAMFAMTSASEVVLDSSAAYLHVEGTAERASRYLGPDATVAAILRDPVERAVSAYLHSVKHGTDLRSAEEAFALDSTSAADMHLEESGKVKIALRRGLITLRDRAEDAYFDPIFHFRYVTNSFYRCQLNAFTRSFASVIIIDFRDLIAQPVRIADLVRQSVGLTDTVDYKVDVSRNQTSMRRWATLRRHRRRTWGPRLDVLSATWRAWTQRYDKAYLKRVARGPWTEAAIEEYLALTRECRLSA